MVPLRRCITQYQIITIPSSIPAAISVGIRSNQPSGSSVSGFFLPVIIPPSTSSTSRHRTDSTLRMTAPTATGLRL